MPTYNCLRRTSYNVRMIGNAMPTLVQFVPEGNPYVLDYNLPEGEFFEKTSEEPPVNRGYVFETIVDEGETTSAPFIDGNSVLYISAVEDSKIKLGGADEEISLAAGLSDEYDNGWFFDSSIIECVSGKIQVAVKRG